MIFHENRLLADDSHEVFRKLGKMLQNLSSAAVVNGILRVNFPNIVICRFFFSNSFQVSNSFGHRPIRPDVVRHYLGPMKHRSAVTYCQSISKGFKIYFCETGGQNSKYFGRNDLSQKP